MDLDQGRSGAPTFPIDEDTLEQRMDAPPWSLDYFRHQRDGAYWRAPVRRLEDIHIPCFLIGGWQDGYRNSIARMLERVQAPVRAWVGPWNHDLPNQSIYGPRVEWRDQAVRWFDRWLKGIDNGVERDPRVVIYMQHGHPPGAEPQDIPGEWRRQLAPGGIESANLVFRAQPSANGGAGRGCRRSPSICAVGRSRSGVLVGRAPGRSATGGWVQPDV